MFALDGMIRRQLQAMIGEAGDADVKVRNGCIEINDVHFDETAMEDLIFPVAADHNVPAMKLKTLHVKKLAINIPWGSFSSGFVDVEVDGLTVLLCRRPAAEVTVEMLRERKEACVAELMAGLVEAVSSMSDKKKKDKPSGGDKGEDKGGGKGGGGGGPLGGLPGPMQRMVLGLIRKILESFRPIIRLTNIHIRYEDLAVDAVARLALGVTVGKLIVQHPDSPYSEIEEDPEMMPVKDVVDLEVAIAGVGVYMHTGSMGAVTCVGGGPEAQAKAKAQGATAPALTGAAAKRWAATNGGEDDRTVEAMARLFGQLMRGEAEFGAQQWIIKPIAISGKVHVNVGIFIGAPTRFDWGHMAVADLTVEPIRVAVSAEQASFLVIAGSELMLMPARYLYKMLRPKRASPRARWRAAGNAVLSALVELSGATRLKAAIRDRMQYQRTLVDAMAKMRERDANIGTELEDVMHVTTESKGKLNPKLIAETTAASTGPGAAAGAAAEEKSNSAVEALLEVDALTTPMQIALWRLVAWAQAKDEAEKGKLEGRGKRRMLGAAIMSKAKQGVSTDDLMAASSELAEEAEEEGDDPLADAPAGFEMAVVNLRLKEVSAQLLLDDSSKSHTEKGGDGGGGQAGSVLPAIELAAYQVQMQSDPTVKTVTTTTTSANLDGSITTTTTVTTFRKPVEDRPLTTVLGASLTPVVCRARITPKPLEGQAGTGLHLCVGKVLLEHQVARGSDETQPLILFDGSTDLPDTSPLLGPPMPVVEVPRPRKFGLLGAPPPKPKPKAKPADGAEGDGTDATKPMPPALHLTASLPPDPPPGEFPPNGSTVAALVIHRGEARICPHQLRELFQAFFVPLDKAMDLVPGAAISREMLFEMAEIAEGFVVRPWWGICNALPTVLQAVKELVNGANGEPGLLGLNVTAEIREGIVLHLLGEPRPGTALGGPRHTVPIGTVQLPPLSAALFPVETEEEQQVHLRVGLLDDVVLATKKHLPPLRPLSGPGAAPLMDPSRLSAVLLSEQLMLLDELKAAREANNKLASELQTLRATYDAHAAEERVYRLWPSSARAPTSPAAPGSTELTTTAFPTGLSAKARTNASGPQSNKRLVGLADNAGKVPNASTTTPDKGPSTPNAALAPATPGSARASSPKRGFVSRMIPRRAASPKKQGGGDNASAGAAARGPSVEA